MVRTDAGRAREEEEEEAPSTLRAVAEANDEVVPTSGWAISSCLEEGSA
jgi:hypothetical protein